MLVFRDITLLTLYVALISRTCQYTEKQCHYYFPLLNIRFNQRLEHRRSQNGLFYIYKNMFVCFFRFFLFFCLFFFFFVVVVFFLFIYLFCFFFIILNNKVYYRYE